MRINVWCIACYSIIMKIIAGYTCIANPATMVKTSAAPLSGLSSTRTAAGPVRLVECKDGFKVESAPEALFETAPDVAVEHSTASRRSLKML